MSAPEHHAAVCPQCPAIDDKSIIKFLEAYQLYVLKTDSINVNRTARARVQDLKAVLEQARRWAKATLLSKGSHPPRAVPKSVKELRQLKQVILEKEAGNPWAPRERPKFVPTPGTPPHESQPEPRRVRAAGQGARASRASGSTTASTEGGNSGQQPGRKKRRL